MLILEIFMFNSLMKANIQCNIIFPMQHGIQQFKFKTALKATFKK